MNSELRTERHSGKLATQATEFAAAVVGHTATYIILSVIGPIAGAYLLKDSGLQLPVWAVVLILAIPVGVAALLAWAFSRRKIQLSDGFDAEMFASAARTANEIRIINTYIPNVNTISSTLRAALDRGTEVNILMLRPDCKEVDYRAATLGIKPTELSKRISDACNALKAEVYDQTKNKNLLNLRFHSSWIPFSLYSTNKLAFVGYFFFGLLAVDGPNLKLKRPQAQFDTFWEQFDLLWSDATSASIARWRADLDLKHRSAKNAPRGT